MNDKYIPIYPATCSLAVHSTRWPSHRAHKKDLTFVRSDLLQEKDLQFPAQDSWQTIKMVTLFWTALSVCFCWVSDMRCVSGILPFITWAWIQEFGVGAISNYFVEQ